MKNIICPPDPESAKYTHLHACICEEQDGYVVQVRLFNLLKMDDAAWGEEVADCLETAAKLLETLAAEFSIPQQRITIEIRTDDLAGSTRH